MQWKYKRSVGESVMLARHRVEIDRNGLLVADGGLSNGASLQMTLNYDDVLRRAVVKSLTVESQSVGTEVHTSLLHEIHITDALRRTVLEHMVRVSAGATGPYVPADTFLASVQPSHGRDRADVAHDVELLYVVTSIANLPPLKSISEILEVSHRTAARLVAVARERDSELFHAEPSSIDPRPVDELREILARPRKPTSDDG